MTAKLSDVLGRIVGVCVRYPVATIAVVLLLAAVSGRYAAGHLGINTDTADMIAPTLPWRQDFIAYREAFPARDGNIVAAVDAAEPAVASVAARRLADALSARPALFDSVFLAGHGEFFERNALMYLSLPALERLGDDLVAAQPLIGRLGAGFSGAAVLDLAADALTAGAAPALDPATVEPLYREIAAVVDAVAAGTARPLRWRTLIGDPPAAGDGRQLLVLKPRMDFDRIRPAQAAIAAIEQETLALKAGIDDSVSVRLTGTVAMEHEELVSVTRGASAAGIAALVMVVAVLLWALRSIVLLALSLVTLLTGLVFTAAFAAVTVGHLNLISVTFAVLYVGLGVDFILHLCLRHKELIAAGHEPRRALVETARGVGASLVICAVTTAAGFFAFVPTDFDGVSELGLISGGGMFISLVVSLSLLPALLAAVWRPDPSRMAPASARLALAGRGWLSSPRASRIVAASAAVIGLVALSSLPKLGFDSNPIRLRDPDSESIRLLDELAATSRAPVFSMAAIAETREEAASWAAALMDEPAVERVVTAWSLLPAEQAEKAFVLEDLRFVLGDDFSRIEPVPFEDTTLDGALDRLRNALPGAPASAGADLLGDALEHLRQAEPAEPPERDARLRALDRDLRSDLPAELARLKLRLAAEPFGLADLPAALRERWIDASGRTLVEFVPAEDLNDNVAASRFVAAVKAAVPRATGLPVVYQEASRTIVDAFIQALSYAFVMVAVLLLVLLRRVGETVLVLLPILFAAAVTAGAAVWLGLPFNFANIIALPLLIGVGVDNGIHIVHRMRTEPPSGGSPFATSTSRAVLASGLTTIASFGNLAFSSHLGMASMGQLLTIGMVVTLVATLVLLPALLALRPRA